MQNHFTVRGIPQSLAADSWWLDSSDDTTRAPEVNKKSEQRRSWASYSKLPILGVLILVLVADFLFWQQSLGLSVALYAIVIFCVSTHKVSLKSRIGPLLLLVFGAMPVIEYIQLLSILFLCVSLAIALIWAHQPNIKNSKYTTAMFRLLAALPVSGLTALFGYIQCLRSGAQGTGSDALKGFARNWAFPIGGSLVFFTLLVDANPFFAQVLSVDVDVLALLNRIAFWFGLGVLIWPLADGFTFDDRDFSIPNNPMRLPNLGLNAASVFRALVMFNLLIGVQTCLDLSIFVGGGDLPDGMSYASYAHRGAYPLVITALLAGAFAISARPFLQHHRLLKPLLLLWLAQNVALCVSAGLRLELYIDVYGLTYSRVRALIWMGVVALGLSLTAWQIIHAHSNRWLILHCSALGASTLYICCFVNFAAMIATVNIPHHQASAYYLCELGPTAHQAITDGVRAARAGSHEVGYLRELEACRPDAPTIDGWRDWGLRKWRIAA